MAIRQLVDFAVKVLEDKKGKDISLIDISGLTVIADYFVICSGTSVTHVKSLSDEVEEKLSEKDMKPLHKEGYNSSRWILLDYGDFVIHIMHEEERAFYNLERLWSDGNIKMHNA